MSVNNSSFSRPGSSFLSHEELPRKEQIYDRITISLCDLIFKEMSPSFKRGYSAVSLYSKSVDYYAKISAGIAESYFFTGKLNSLELEKTLTEEKIKEFDRLFACYRPILDRERLSIFGEIMSSDENEEELELPDLNSKISDWSANPDSFNTPSYGEIQNEETILAVLNSKLYADVVKIRDKYSIRIGDGRYYVASDEISVVFRDPSEKPAWAVWFLTAVPLAEIPNKADLLLMNDQQRHNHCPAELPDQPIICHASLWDVDKKSGLLLHVSWGHISATYKWIINKPMDVASIMFKSVSHPAHLARNFGYTPNLVIPGGSWL